MRTVQREGYPLHLDKVAIEDSLINAKLDQLVNIEEISILLAKSNFTVEVDDLLLGAIDTKVFCRSRVDFADTLDKVITNTQKVVEEDRKLLEKDKDVNQLLNTENNS